MRTYIYKDVGSNGGCVVQRSTQLKSSKIGFTYRRVNRGGLLVLISSVGYLRLCCLLLVAACGPSLTACTLPFEQLTLPSPLIGSNSPERGTVGTRPPGLPLSGPGAVATIEPRVYTGSGEFASNKELLPSATSAETKDGISLNLVGASAAEVAKTVLGDVLGVNYMVSDKVKANITLHTV